MSPNFPRNLLDTRSLIAAAALALTGCSSLPFSDSAEPKPLPNSMQNRLDRLLHQVHYAKGSTLLAQLRELSAFGSYATGPVIEELMVSPDPRLRAGAVFVLGEIDRLDGDERAKEAVTKALDDADRSVRLEAARALLEGGDPRAASMLVEALDDAERGVRIRAFLTLSGAVGERFNYNVDASSDARRAAVERFRTHFEMTEVAPTPLPTAPTYVPLDPIAPTSAEKTNASEG